jgi:hypothetical protein
MEDLLLRPSDLLQMKLLGIGEEQVRAQVEIFKRSSFFVCLNRPCILGDGVHLLDTDRTDELLGLHLEAAEAGRFLKFVPASGAASRMFQLLLREYQRHEPRPLEEIQRQAETGDSACLEFLEFIEQMDKFAFFDGLRAVMAEDGLDLRGSVRDQNFQQVLEYLLTEKGLNYRSLPKGLIPFHRYDTETRTPFEEHLVEAAHYVQERSGVCRLHFTVSPQHEAGFRGLLERVRSDQEKRYGVRYEVRFSHQRESSHTIAVDHDNHPFRDRQGHLLFRPAGHGALLANLNELQGDLVYVKNIDNVVPDHLKNETTFWKKVLGGYLVQIQEKVHSYLRALESTASQGFLQEVAGFCRERIGVVLPESFAGRSLDDKRDFLYKQLNRPIRVCGMVRNVGEPGGGPFWVEGKEATLSLQIVESAQVDFSVPEQQELWQAATHFNPVDLVCALKDYQGNPFNLHEFMDPEAVFISHKSKDGMDLKALELPGLWNGSMADWITLFVEVPMITFNPVKTVNDLLRSEHQPEAPDPPPANS